MAELRDLTGPIAYGCWRFAGTGVEEAAAKIDAALDAGMTLVDTADIYGYDGSRPAPGGGFGAAEELLGAVLARSPGMRERMVLATKGGIVPPVPYDSSANYLRRAAEASLARLGVERIDLYQVHRPDVFTHPAEVAGVLDELVSSGKVAAVGVSNHTVAQTEALAAHLSVPLASMQPEFSVLEERPMTDGTLDMAMLTGALVLAWSPLAGGRLGDPLDARDPRARAVAEVCDRIAAEQGVTRSAVLLGWVMSHPAGVVPIIGTQRIDRIRECARAVEVQLDRSQYYEILTASRGATAVSSEVAWFAALCDDDYEFLGVPDPRLASSWEHCRDIVLAAEQGGFDNILLPSGYALGIDGVAFAGGMAALTRRIRMLLAVRCAEMWPPQLARQLAGLDQMLEGRLTINIISSDLPGQTLESAPRYRRTLEVMQVLAALLEGEPVRLDGEFHQLDLEPPRIALDRARERRAAGLAVRPPFYFGGLSEPAREVAAQAADVYLMWPDTMDSVAGLLDDMRARAGAHGRRLRFGYRVHVVVRETETEARRAAARLMSRVDESLGEAIRQRSLDTASAGVARQGELREAASDDGFVEDNLFTGIGRARSGCGAAIVGDPDQVLAKLRAYESLGIDAFILSGYPHRSECDLFARHVLPRLRGPS